MVAAGKITPSPNGSERMTMDEVLVLMIVDDDDTTLALMEAILQRPHAYGAKLKPLRVVKARSGKECIDLLPTTKPIAIVTDALMPGMSGFELAGHLINEMHYIQPIIMLTGMLSPAAREQALSVGIVHFLTKPIDQRQFFKDLVLFVPALSAVEQQA